MNKKNIVLFGTGSFAQVAHVYLSQDSDFNPAAFTVDQEYITETRLRGLDVVPFEQLASSHPPDEFAMLAAIGYKRMNRPRMEIYRRCKALGYEMISYVSSKATHWGEITIGENCFIFEQNVIQPFVTIGDNVVMWSGNHIGHHTTIGDHCFLASHAVISGHVTIGDNCFIGVNATLRDGITVAPETVIGAGAVILKDTIAQGVYRGRATEPAGFRSDELRKI